MSDDRLAQARAEAERRVATCDHCGVRHPVPSMYDHCNRKHESASAARALARRDAGVQQEQGDE